MAFFKKASSFFKKSGASFNSNSTTKQVDAMSAGLGLNAQSLSQLEEQEENKVSRAKDLATNKNVDESTLKEHAAQRQKERQEVRLVNRFMSRTLSGGSGSETASSVMSRESSKYFGMSDGEILDDLGCGEDNLLTGELSEDKHLRRALDQLTERLRNGAEDVEICLMEEIHSMQPHPLPQLQCCFGKWCFVQLPRTWN